MEPDADNVIGEPYADTDNFSPATENEIGVFRASVSNVQKNRELAVKPSEDEAEALKRLLEKQTPGV